MYCWHKCITWPASTLISTQPGLRLGVTRGGRLQCSIYYNLEKVVELRLASYKSMPELANEEPVFPYERRLFRIWRSCNGGCSGYKSTPLWVDLLQSTWGHKSRAWPHGCGAAEPSKNRMHILHKIIKQEDTQCVVTADIYYRQLDK